MKRRHTFDSPLPKRTKSLLSFRESSDVSDTSERSSGESESGWSNNLFSETESDSDVCMQSPNEECISDEGESVRESKFFFIYKMFQELCC